MQLKPLALALAGSILTFGAAQAATPPQKPTSGIDFANFDREVRPQDDFFRYVNGHWLATTQIPPDRSRWGTFDALRERSLADQRAILESPAPAGDAEAQATRDFYKSFMDNKTVDELGLKPLMPELARIAALDSAAAVARYIGSTSYGQAGAPFGVFTSIDRGNSKAYAVYVWQSGLGMPDRDYYLRTDPKFVAIRKQYQDYLDRLFTLAAMPEPAARAKTVFDIEHALAEVQWTRVANRDPKATYNMTDVADAAKLAPGFAWPELLEGAGLPDNAHFVLGQPSYATAFAKLLGERPLDDWKVYLQARLLDAYAPYLSEPFVQAEFEFNGHVLSGTEELRARWKRAVDAVNHGMGFVVGREYVAKHFPPAAKARMETLVHNLLAAMNADIEHLSWMTPATRKEAHDKLLKIRAKIGYPEVWRSYTGLEIQPDDLLGNLMRADAFEWNRQLKRLDKPVDPTEWLMTPQTVNAYYMPPANEVVFPAAILQPPFFNFDADEAVNYGAIGAVIGHEISHGFDDKGRMYDGNGNLRDWWTPADDAAFKQRTARLVAQYNAYRPVPDLTVNGELTLGENIGDLSGLAIAWKAWHMSLDRKPSPVIDGLTGAQRFFCGFGQIWRGKTRPEALRRQVLSDPHSPGQFRADGVLSNFGPFYETYHLKQGDKLWRPEADRVKIW